MRKEVKCFLDLDGVLVDFVPAAFAACGASNRYISDPSTRGEYNMEKILGITSSRFWENVNSFPSFWEDLAPTNEASEIVALCEEKFGRDNIHILTAPSPASECFTGKRRWVRDHFPQYHKKIIFAAAPLKYLLSGERRVLIDDRDSNITQWRDAGGSGVLCPRFWNSAHPSHSRVLEVLREELEKL